MKKLLASAAIVAALACPMAAQADHITHAEAFNGGMYIDTADGYWCFYRDVDPATAGNRMFADAIAGLVNPNLSAVLYPAWRAGWGYTATDNTNACAELSLGGQ